MGPREAIKRRKYIACCRQSAPLDELPSGIFGILFQYYFNFSRLDRDKQYHGAEPYRILVVLIGVNLCISNSVRDA